ncbi:MAG: hypothetical protein H6587_07075 [Flavobacteriales bacterium]|nr:hypothetical protein [Flavobacteriales bacterium]
MLFKKTYPLFLLLVLSIEFLSAQNQRILVVPYTRFQFVSDFKLEELARINEVEPSEVYKTYIEELNNTLTAASNQQVSFIPINLQEYAKIKKYIRYNLDKFNGRNYNASNLSLLPKDDYTALLKEHNATHIMFINWYSITKSVQTTYIGDRNKRQKYSTHAIDYDVYNQEKIRIIGKNKATLDCGNFPSESVINNKSLNAKELKFCYNNLILEFINELTSTVK